MALFFNLMKYLAFALVLDFLILYGGYYYCSFIPIPNSNDFGDKLKYTLRCMFPALLVLQTAIANVGIKRVTSGTTNPLAGKEQNIQADKNILTSTLEQLVIYIGLNMVLITFLEPSEMRIIPLYMIVFVVGRILFVIGYPNRRAAGMYMLFVSVTYFGFLIMYLMFSRGLMYDIPHDAVDTKIGDKTEL